MGQLSRRLCLSSGHFGSITSEKAARALSPGARERIQSCVARQKVGIAWRRRWKSGMEQASVARWSIAKEERQLLPLTSANPHVNRLWSAHVIGARLSSARFSQKSRPLLRLRTTSSSVGGVNWLEEGAPNFRRHCLPCLRLCDEFNYP